MNASLDYNIIIFGFEILYSISISLTINLLVKRGKLTNINGRKLFHILMGGLILFWFFYQTVYAKVLFSLVPLGFISLILIAALGKAPHKGSIARLTRSGNIKEATKGPLLFFLMLVLITTVGFKSIAGLTSLCAMAFGDGIAPFLGKNAKHKMPNGKSIEGAFGVFIGSLLSSFIIYALFFEGTAVSAYIMLIIAATAASIIEFFTPSNYDNRTVPLSVFMLLYIIQII